MRDSATLILVASLISICLTAAQAGDLGLRPVRPRRSRRTATDYQPGGHPSLKLSSTPVPYASRGSTMMIATAINIDPCESYMGNYINMLGIKNKEDYARMHGYGFYYAIDQQNATLFGPWNKIKVLQMLSNKLDRSDAEWIMWVDNDALFLNVLQKPPFERYIGKDLIMWGDEKYTYQDLDPELGLNGGMMIFRNTEWTRRFLAELAEYGVDWWHPRKESPFEPEMKAELKNYHRALYEQNAIVHILKNKPQYREKVFLDNWDYWALHATHKYLPVEDGVELYTTYSKRADKTAYVAHFAGCQFCNPTVAKQEVTDCVSDFVKVFSYSYNKMQTVLQETREFPTWWLVNFFVDKLNTTKTS